MIEGLPCFQMKQRKDIADLHIEASSFARHSSEPPRGFSGPGRSCGPCRPQLMSVRRAIGRLGGEVVFLRHDRPGPDFGFCQRRHSGLGYPRDWVSRLWYHNAQRSGTSGAIHVSQVPESGRPRPLPPPIGCNLSTNRKRKPKWRRCVAASIAVGPSAILTGSRTRPSDWGSNARFGPVEDRRNNRRLATFTCTLCVLQIW